MPKRRNGWSRGGSGYPRLFWTVHVPRINSLIFQGGALSHTSHRRENITEPEPEDNQSGDNSDGEGNFDLKHQTRHEQNRGIARICHAIRTWFLRLVRYLNYNLVIYLILLVIVDSFDGDRISARYNFFFIIFL